MHRGGSDIIASTAELKEIVHEESSNVLLQAFCFINGIIEVLISIPPEPRTHQSSALHTQSPRESIR